MKRFAQTAFGRYVHAVGASVHPVRAIFEVCATAVFAIPFLAAFALNRAAPLYVYLLYPALFLVSHFVWFRLPFVEKRVRWGLFWFSLTIIVALGAGFLYWNYRETAAGNFKATGIFRIPEWVNPKMDVPFPTVGAYFLLPSALGAAFYCFVLALFLRIYRTYRQEEHQRRARGDHPQ